MRPRLLLVLIALLAAPVAALVAAPAAALEPAEVPEPLKPWIPWVLEGTEATRCTPLTGAPDLRRCEWPARLDLELGGDGGRFRQAWRVEADTWVPLPGSEQRRPLDVRVDGGPGVVFLKDGRPGVRLSPGDHVVTGAFAWDTLPEAVEVPAETGLVDLRVNDQRIRMPQRDEQGRIWLQRGPSEEVRENRLEILVHRKIVDEIPLQMITRIELRVSGDNREVLIGPALLPALVPMSLDSPLPARVEPDRRIRVQVRPGTWILELVARHEGPASELTLAPTEGLWAPTEVWVLEARPELRIIEVEGVPAIDPQQTRLPEDWRNLPAYRVDPGDTVRLVERRRGDAEPAPDQLALNRVLWLDFDGGGLTIQDQLSGTLHSGWRLVMQPPTTLGRVSVDGHDQLITRLGEADSAGVEVRKREIQVEAHSRFEGGPSDVPAVGWDHAFQSVSATLNVPPGWRLFHASGVDDVPSTWIKGWTLLDIFLALVLAIATARLWGWGWGALALATFVLIFPEEDAPMWIWAFVLAGEGLLRVIPQGWFRRVVQLYQWTVIVVLAAVAVPFMVQQVRQGMYPALERPNWTIAGQYAGSRGFGGFTLGAAAPKAAYEEADQAYEGSWSRSERAELKKMETRNYAYQVDPKALVQTGPGLPRWSWKQVRLIWNGPVAPTQRLHLYFVPPWLNLILAFVRMLLVAILGIRVLGLKGDLRSLLRRPRTGAAAAALLALAALSPGVASAEMPSKEVLDELRTRLLEPADCLPTCASSPRMRLEATPTRLSLRMEIDADARTAVPLPADARHWMPDTVILDGAPADALARAGDRLWMAVREGKHQVTLEGALPRRELVQIPLPLRPGRVTASARGWTLEGLHMDGIADASLQLTRVRTEADDAGRLEPEALPPFVRIERSLKIGLTWEVETHLFRVTPPGSAVVLEVPLLPGESPTTEGVRVVDGKVLVTLGPQQRETIWTSALEQKSPMVLTAPKTSSWAEVWRLDVSPVWHAETEGIPPVHQEAATAVRTWRPWPGETLTVNVVRPEPVPGRSLTIESSVLTLRPGTRATDASLVFELRSSRGGQHVVTLPETAELQTVRIDGQEQPIRQEGRKVALPVHPGQQTVRLDWREDRPYRLAWRSSEVDLGAESVNASLQVNPPTSRWILFLFGPRVGPAVLFWSMLVVLLVVAFGLSRVPLTPLRFHEWFLLGIGLTQTSIWLALVIVGWLLFLGWRRRRTDVGYGWFDLRQVILALWGIAALVMLVVAVSMGLLGEPDMQITGNGSGRYGLQWYVDRVGTELPGATVMSVPIFVYRLAMLAWALWLAWAVIRWLKWGWSAFTEGGLWRSRPAQPVIARATGGGEPGPSGGESGPTSGTQPGATAPSGPAPQPPAGGREERGPDEPES